MSSGKRNSAGALQRHLQRSKVVELRVLGSWVWGVELEFGRQKTDLLQFEIGLGKQVSAESRRHFEASRVQPD